MVGWRKYLSERYCSSIRPTWSWQNKESARVTTQPNPKIWRPGQVHKFVRDLFWPSSWPQTAIILQSITAWRCLTVSILFLPHPPSLRKSMWCWSVTTLLSDKSWVYLNNWFGNGWWCLRLCCYLDMMQSARWTSCLQILFGVWFFVLLIGIRRILCLIRRVSTVTKKWKFVHVISHIGGICDRMEVLEIPPQKMKYWYWVL